jgi:hypothetical protein
MHMVAFPPNAAVAEIWDRVRAWSAEDRMSLATRIIESLQSEPAAPPGMPPPKPTASAADLIGLWADVDPKPSDEELRRILEDSIYEKHSP